MNTRPSPAPPPARPAGAGFTLIELLVVIAIIGVLAGILIPVLGAVRRTARKVTCTSNMRQLGVATQLWLGDNKDVMYPQKNAPTNWTYMWFDYLRPYIPRQPGAARTGSGLRSSLFCPLILDTHPDNTTQRNFTGYGKNANLGRLPGNGGDLCKKITADYAPSRVVLFWDDSQRDETAEGRMQSSSDGGWPKSTSSYPGSYYNLAFRHGDTCNLLFLDGHVASIKPGANRDARDFPELVWDVPDYPDAPMPALPSP
ncbi:MAG: prepilin-type N-terminal cleavage/methylation domain-containing protein [Opitutaceae bacterium]|jgi:general secretion pathway protein G|nr:prepilin-type N-terminal cleavage/methylation domain-containing protein [Opitutaceae bacterium]